MIAAVVSTMLSCAQPPAPAAERQVVAVTSDNTVVTSSCLIRIAPGAVIADADGNGVIHVKADGIDLEFEEGSVLAGAGAQPPNSFSGVGVRIQGHRNVTVREARIRGFRAGIYASQADGLAVSNSNLSDNFRQRLGSTPAAEDSTDWLWPHANDSNEWLTNYGAALYIEESRAVTVHDVTVRRGQNGIILDDVADSKVYDNDCSFLSGWGLAMWRSSGNLVSRNAFDFCVRGHSEGVYNRGQDSAGILVFEQCNNNTFALNSATHGGDGFFGFAGKEALGEAPPRKGQVNYARSGCNDNLLIGNDFSFAPAHGIEMTFSEGNRFIRNRLVDNAVCGIWAGYSRETLIAENVIQGNGGMAYGQERGGINIEHGADNLILSNIFINNRCGVHLWWDDDGKVLELPGVSSDYRGVSGNVVANNTFEINKFHPFKSAREQGSPLVVLHMRDLSTTAKHFTDNLYVGNTLALSDERAVERDVALGCEPLTMGPVPSYDVPEYQDVGAREPVGARPELQGRHNIIMGEWGPWDHEEPMVRRADSASGTHTYEVFGALDGINATASGSVSVRTEKGDRLGMTRVTVEAGSGVTPYSLVLTGSGVEYAAKATLINAQWAVTFFPWTIDPREDIEGWRRQAEGEGAVQATIPGINLPFGGGGPRRMKVSPRVTEAGPGPDRFGVIGKTKLLLPKGRWIVRATSDDGVRVTIGGRPVIENWSWHGPTEDAGEFVQSDDGEVEVGVEYFEIDGAAILQLAIEPAE